MKINCLKISSKISVIIAVFLLNACAIPPKLDRFIKGNDRNNDAIFEKLDNKEKGLVLFRVLNSANSAVASSDRIKGNAPYVIKKLSDGNMRIIQPKERQEFRVDTHTSSNIFAKGGTDYVDAMLFLDPGIYSIVNISLPFDGHTMRWYEAKEYDENNRVPFGAFEIKAGEIIALGSLDVYDGKLHFKLEDANIEQDLKKAKLDYLIPKVKPGVFYGKNSLFHEYTNVEGDTLCKLMPYDIEE